MSLVIPVSARGVVVAMDLAVVCVLTLGWLERSSLQPWGGVRIRTLLYKRSRIAFVSRIVHNGSAVSIMAQV